MKSYEEVAKSVFEKSEKYFEEKAIRAKHIKTAATAMSCFCLAAVLTVGAVAALNSNLTERPVGGSSEGQLANEPDNNGNIPVSDETTTETEPLTTPPELAPDTNDAPDNINETLENDYGIVSNGVFEPFFIAFDGALYVSYDSGEGGFYEPTGLDVYLAENYTCKVCAVQGRPNNIGVVINSFTSEYKKLFDCNFDIDGTKYQIAYNALKDVDHACGDIVLETDDFTVYEAVRLQGEPLDTKEYIVDLLPVLKREFPGIFIDDPREYGDDYGDAWWIALSNIDIPEEDPSVSTAADSLGTDIPTDLPLNTLVGVTPADIDSILAPAAAAAYSTATGKSKSVFVAAETGSEIYSLTDGVVTVAEYSNEYGFTVEVDIGNGKSVKYYHLSEMLAEVGDTVTRGQVIGLAGTTEAIACSGAGYTFITDHTETHESETHETDNHHSGTHH